MFLRQVFGLTGSTLLVGLPGHTSQCRFRLSYLLTAAGQFRNLTGFPINSSCEETWEWSDYILGQE